MAVYDLNGTNIGVNVYDIDGNLLSQAYDIQGNPLLPVHPSDQIEILPNRATGDSTGFSFWLYNPGYSYPLYEVVDFMSDSYAFQSFCYDPQNNLFYKFDATTTVRVYNSEFQKIGTITLPQSAGHTNDACYKDGKIYFPGDHDETNVYVWDIANNTVSVLPVYDLPDPPPSAEKVAACVCNVPDENGYLYLVYIDMLSNELNHNPNDKIEVYKYNLTTNTVALIASYPWDCVYAQGAEIYDGIMYIACNSPTTGAANNYTGITLKAIRLSDWAELPSLYAVGNFEPEGLSLYPYGANPELMIGVGKYAVYSMVARFSIPYRIINQLT